MYMYVSFLIRERGGGERERGREGERQRGRKEERDREGGREWEVGGEGEL